MDDAVCFRPSRVEGVANVDTVCVSRDALEFISAGKRIRIAFLDFARVREISSGRMPVGELHFSKSYYPDSHFVFYTTPRITVFMPLDGPTTCPRSHFWRLQEILREGGCKLYDGAPPERLPPVLDPRPGRTVAYAAAVMLFCWAYALAGFLPGQAGAAWRGFLISNPRNPNIGVAFMLPAIVVPVMVAVRHAKERGALLAVIAASYGLALTSEWGLRQVIHNWLAIEQPPFSQPFWSVHRFGSLLIVVSVAALAGASWRGAYLEPVKRPGNPRGESVRSRGRGA